MAHQCLKCGNSYPDGSTQILKGCEGCKGTRFFYTDAPLDEEARNELAGQTDIDLERLALGKGDTERPRHIPTKGELPVGRGDGDWVAGGPNYLRGVVEDVVRRAQERRPVFRVGTATERPAKTIAEWVQEADASGEAPAEGVELAPAADEILDDLFAPDREAEWRRRSGPSDAASVPDGPEPAAPETDRSATTADPDVEAEPSVADESVVYQRSPRRIPRPVSLAGVAIEADEDARLRAEARRDVAAEEAARPPRPEMSDSAGVEESLYPEGEAPETVAVSDPGVYELDVKRLLEKSPIVVHRDGSYSLHLPSLMETLEKGKRR